MATDYKSQLKGNNGALFQQYWKTLPEPSENVVRVFVRDALGHFTLHGKDTKFMSEILNIESTVRKGNGEMNTTGMDWAMVNLVQLRQLLRELVIVRGFRVEIYDRDGDGDWEGVFGSPGNLSTIEQYIFDPSGIDMIIPTCRVMALSYMKQSAERNVYAIAIVDAETREALVATVDDDGRCSQLESILVQVQVREVITSNTAKERLKEAINRCSTLLTTVKKDYFAMPTIDDVSSIFTKGFTAANDDHLQCVSAAVKYLDLGQNCQLKSRSLDMARFARLDASIFENLHLCSLNETSIYSILSAGCVTTQGARLLRKWITQPLVRRDEIIERQEIVSTLIENDELRNRLATIELKRLPDISKVMLKIGQFSRTDAKLSTVTVLNTLLRVNMVCQRLPVLIELLTPIENPQLQSALVQPITMLDGKIQKLVMLIDTHIESNRKVRFKRGIDSELDEITEKLESMEESMEDLLDSVSEDLNIPRKEVKLDEATDGMVFRVFTKHDKTLNKNKSYERLSTTKSAITFTNATLREYSDMWQEKMNEYETHAKLIVQKMITIVIGYTKYLVQLGEVTGMLDAFVGLANAAVSTSEPWVKPEFTDDKLMSIEDIRHPILDYKNVDVVPNDVIMSNEKRFMILTGPNMGGKSTYLRATAVCAILAQIGSFVPASSAKLPIFDAIIARIGAGDNIQRGISTFLHEMIETETIFRTATKNSLIVIDELGRGTSTWDGFGLAFAIAEALVDNIKCFGLFATHYHEMASLPSKCSAAFNMHTSVFVDEEKVTHLYKVEAGSCSKSYGIDIARLVGFDPKVLDRAAELNNEMEHIEQISATELNIATRVDAIAILKETVKIAKESGDKIQVEEILNFVKNKNNPILNAALKA